MRITVIGAGAIGSVLGAFLSLQHEVTLIGRQAHMEAVVRGGLRVSGIWGDRVFTGLSAVTDIAGLGTQDLVVICTKSYDTGDAARQGKPLLHAASAVLSMQNGIGNEETIAREVGRDRTLGGMVIFGAVMARPGHVEVTVYASQCKIGALGSAHERAAETAAALTACGIPAVVSDDILAAKWLKGFYNMALNPLSTILQVPYGILGERDEARAVIRQLLEEAFAVAEADRVRLTFSASEYFQYLMSVQLPPTAAHRSSMLQDVLRGKRTEIDYLNGVVVKLGKAHGIATPVNEVLVNIVKALQPRPLADGR